MEDAASSLGTDHPVFKVAVFYVDDLIQRLAARGFPHSVLQREQLQRRTKEQFKLEVLKLLKWA